MVGHWASWRLEPLKPPRRVWTSQRAGRGGGGGGEVPFEEDGAGLGALGGED